MIAAIHTILVVAPDPELRRSIEFLLVAEGFVVESHPLLRTALASPTAGTAACAIVDEDAIMGRPEEEGNVLQRFGRPVILLVDRLKVLPQVMLLRVLVKPLLGGQLVESVARAVMAG